MLPGEGGEILWVCPDCWPGFLDSLGKALRRSEMPETKEAALALIPKASLEVLRAQVLFSQKRIEGDPFRSGRDYHLWLIPLLEAEIKRREV